MIQYSREKALLSRNICVEELGLGDKMTKEILEIWSFINMRNKQLVLNEYNEVIILFAYEIRHELYKNFIWCIDRPFMVILFGYSRIYTIEISRKNHAIDYIYNIKK